MITIPTQAVPAQQFNVTLGGQPCTIALRQKVVGLFLDLSVNGKAIVSGRLCVNGARLVRDAYLGFAGDLVFGDLLGTADPDHTGLGTRYHLIYLEASDL